MKNATLKKILCIVLAVVIAGSAIFFAIYNKTGNVYDYSKNDMSKYLTSIKDIDTVLGYYDGTVTLGTPSQDEIKYFIAKAYSEKGTSKVEGTVGLYDTASINYTMFTTVGTEEVRVADAKYIAPANAVSVQLGTDSDLSRLLESICAAYGEASTYKFNAFTDGPVINGDKLYLTYSVSEPAKVESFKEFNYDKDNATLLEEIYAGLTEKFNEKVNAHEDIIGETLTFSFEDVQVSVKVEFVTRTQIIKDSPVVGDAVWFKYVTVTYDETLGKDVETTSTDYFGFIDSNTSFDETFGDGFTQGLLGATPSAFCDKFSCTKGEGEEQQTINYKVKISYYCHKDYDVATLNDGEYVLAEKLYAYSYTYPEDSTAVSALDATLELKGKEVHGIVYVGSFTDVTYDYDGIINTISYSIDTTEDASLIDLYLTAYAEYKTAVTEYDAKKTISDKAEEDYNAAKSTYDTENAKTEGRLGDDEIQELKDDMDDKKADWDAAVAVLETANTTKNDKDTALTTAFANLNASLADAEKYTTDADESYDAIAQKAYNDYATEEIQNDKDVEYAEAIAKIVWDKLVEVAANDVKENGYPKKAVRVAYNEIVDYYETNYYENRNTAPYSNYATFKEYMNQNVYAGQNYKDAAKAEAQDVVLNKMVLYRLIELFDITLTDNQKMMVNLYTYYSSEGYGASYEIACYFDNAMKAIALKINPDLTLD